VKPHALLSVRSRPGATLRRVVIRALEGEFAHRTELQDPELYIGGEVRLEFEGRALFVSWASRDGWESHFSIGVRPESLFVTDATLRDWDVSDLEPWSLCTGQPLQGVRVFALGETPHVVEFGFVDQAFWMADGYEQSVGDGDDLLIRSGRFPGIDGARMVWSV
jgi:hypothetical protein